MKKFLYAAGFSLVLSGAAFAQPAMPPHEGSGHEPMAMGGGMKRPPMPNFDLNGDGKITLAEFQQSHADRMMRLDANKDGKITEAEFMARPGMMDHDGPPPPPGEDRWKRDGDHPMRHKMMEKMRAEHQGMMFDMLDANDDGAISRDEIDRMTAKQFKRLDKNHDGVLTGDELPKPPMMGGHRKEHGSH
jgi:Ca2+-binding EF-hand superfamily protein